MSTGVTGVNTANASNLKTFAQMYGAGYQPTGTFGAPSVPTQDNQAPGMAPADPNAQNTLEKTPKSDTITIAGKTIKKKTALMAGIGALATAAAIGFIAFRGIKTGKIPPEVKEMSAAADDMKKAALEITGRANEFVETAQKKIDAALDIFKNGGKDADGKVLANITAGSSANEKIMEELAEDGTTVVRRSIFTDDIPSFIEEIIEGGKKNEITLVDGKLSKYEEGIETLADGSHTVTRSVKKNGDKIDAYLEGFKQNNDGSEITERYVGFKDNKVSFYTANSKNLADGSRTREKEIGLDEDGFIEYYTENIAATATGDKTWGKYLTYENCVGHITDNMPKKYEEGLEELATGDRNLARILELNNKNKWVEG